MDINNTAPKIVDIATKCWTCDPLDKYVKLTESFADNLSSTLHDPILMLFASLCGLWIVVSGIKLALKQTEMTQVIKDLVFVSITGILLGSQGAGLISYVYSSALAIMGGSAEAVFSLAGEGQKSSGYSGLVALAANGELAVAKVYQATRAIAAAGSLYDLVMYVYAVVLILPYFLLVVAYSSQVVVAIFRAAMVAVFAPFLFMAFAFDWGRGMAMTGAKTLLASILVLFASTAALSLCIYGVSTTPLDPTQLTGDAINKFASVENPGFLVILFLGWMGTALMAEGTSMANSIAQTALTNAAAGIMTAGAAASGFALKKGGQWAGWLGGQGKNNHNRLWSGATGNGATGNGQAENLVDKFKNINKPSGGAS